MSPSPLDVLRHILDEARFLASQANSMTQKQFLDDEVAKRAWVRSIEIIGEATKQLPDDLKACHEHIEWRAMAGMRDHLIHGYFGVDYEIVWDVAANKAAQLQEQIEELVALESQPDGMEL